MHVVIAWSSGYVTHVCSDTDRSASRAIMTHSTRVTQRLSHFLALNQSAVTYFQGFHADKQRQDAMQLEQLVGHWCEYVVEHEDVCGSVVRVLTGDQKGTSSNPPIGQQWVVRFEKIKKMLTVKSGSFLQLAVERVPVLYRDCSVNTERTKLGETSSIISVV